MSKTPAAQQSTEQQISGNSSSSTPPWGSDEDFNPERAWNLIQNLRNEKETLKSQHETRVEELEKQIETQNSDLTEKNSSLEDAQKRIDSLESESKEKDGTIAEKDALIVKHQLLSKAGIPLNYAAQVTGDDEDAWKASVKSLEELRGSSGVQRTPDPVQAADSTRDTPPAETEEEQARNFFFN